MFNTERRKKVKFFYDILGLKTKIDEICLQSVQIIGSKGSPYSEQRYSAISQMDDIITSKPIMVAVALQNMAIDSKNVPKIAEISLTSSNEELFLTDQLLRLIPQREQSMRQWFRCVQCACVMHTQLIGDGRKQTLRCVFVWRISDLQPMRCATDSRQQKELVTSHLNWLKLKQ